MSSNAFTLKGRDELLLGRILMVAAVLISGLLVLYIAVRFIALPLTTITRVAVESDVQLSEAQILKLAGLQGGERYFSLSAPSVQRRLEASPLVRKARVEKVFPNTLRVTLYRRQPVALVLAEAGGRSIPVLVDRDGYIFKLGVASAEMDLPVISGISAGEASMGSALPAAYQSLFADLAVLRERAPALYRLLSEVRLTGPGAETAVSPESLSYDLLLYFLSSPIRVRVHGVIDENLVKYSLLVIDLLSKQGISRDIEELDFRGGDVVYRMKEG